MEPILTDVVPNVLLPDSLMKVCLFFDYIKRDQAISHLSELVKEDLSCFFCLFLFRIFEQKRVLQIGYVLNFIKIALTQIMSSLVQPQLFQIDSKLKQNGYIHSTMIQEDPEQDRHFQIYLQSIESITNLQIKVQCDKCRRDISKTIKIVTGEADYCPGCFANLQEYLLEYHVIRKLDFPLFHHQWTAQDELFLVEGINKYGFGNWLEIADFIGANKTQEEVQKHYLTTYFDSQGLITRRDKYVQAQNCSQNSPKKVEKHSMRQTTIDVPLKPRKTGGLTVNQSTPETMGYMPKRGDFDVQYDNEAELLLADLQLHEKDTTEERSMKMKLIDIYNARLTQRIRRKQFVISRNLLNLKEQLGLDRTKSKQEKQVNNLMKVFARFNSTQNHKNLVQAVIKQQDIRRKIAELDRLKKRGFKTLAQVEVALDQRYKEQKKCQETKQESYNDKDKNVKQKNKPSRVKKASKKQMSQQIEQLLPIEQDLCIRLNLKPSQYLSIKKAILRESVKLGRLPNNKISKMFNFDQAIIQQILHLLAKTEGITIVQP